MQRPLPLRVAFAALAMALVLGLVRPDAAGACGGFYPPPPKPVPHKSTPCSGCPKNCSASPCFAGTGLYTTSAVDLQIPTNGFPLLVARYYDTSRFVDTLLGNGWKTGITSVLWQTVYKQTSPGVYSYIVTIVTHDGSYYSYTPNADGVTYVPPAGRYDKLIKNGDGSFDLTPQRSRSKFHYTSAGLITTMADDYGNTLTYTYDAQSRPMRIADSSGSGRYLDIFYGGDGRISVIRDNTNRQVQYFYNGTGALSSVIDVAGRTTAYGYLTGRFAPLLSSITDNWGRLVTTVTYSATTDRVVTYTEDGETYTMNYLSGSTTTKTDSAGRTWTYTYGADGQIADRQAQDGSKVHTDYNADGSTQQIIDEVGVKTCFTYNGIGAVASITRDCGGPLAVRFDYAYDTNYPEKVVSITPKDPATGQVNHDWQGWQYDYYQSTDLAPGALKHAFRVKSDATTDAIGTYVYDSKGRVAKFTSAAGNATDYGYDTQGNRTPITLPANNGAGTRPVTQYGYDALGRITSIADPLGKVTSSTYDGLDRILTTTLPRPSAASPLNFITTFTYDTFDASSGLVLTNVTDPNNRVTKTGYDQFGRLARSVDAVGGTTTYGYSQGLLSFIRDTNSYTTTYTYDTKRLLASTVFADGLAESYVRHADGLLRSVTDRKSQTVIYGYDGMKRLTSLAHPVGAISFTFAGQKAAQVSDTTVTPSELHAFTYDPSYRVAAETQATRGTVSYTYTGEDKLATYAVAGGPTASYTYYPSSHLNTITWSAVTGPFKYVYDLRGQYQTVTLPNGQTRSYTYDDLGRLLQIANTHPSAGNLASYAYGYDVDNYVGSQTLLGRRTSMTATVPSQGFGGALTKYYYDGNYRLSQVAYPAASPFNSEVAAWTYDGVGNRLTSTVNGTTQSYTYQRLGSNANNWQRLLQDGLSTYTYDANGSLTSASNNVGTTAYGWDAANRMTSAASLVFSYDYGSRRAAVLGGGASSTFVYVGNQTVAELSSLPVDYLVGPTTDELLAASRSGVTSYYAVDGLGSIGLVSDASGGIQNSYTYDAWGAVRNLSGSTPNRFGYTGRETDPGGLMYYRARYYSQSSGRFASVDPLGAGWPHLLNGFQQSSERGTSLNGAIVFAGLDQSTYGYVGGDPVRLSDPYGLYAGVDDAVFAGGGAVVGLLTQAAGDLLSGQLSGWEDYVGSAVGGAVTGEALLYVGPIAAGTAGAALGNLTKQGLRELTGKQCEFNRSDFLVSAGIGFMAGTIPGVRIPGLTAGANSYNAIFKQMTNKFASAQIGSVSGETAAKMFIGRGIDASLFTGIEAAGIADAVNRGLH